MDKQDTSKMIIELEGVIGLTQEEFVAKIGVTHSTINR